MPKFTVLMVEDNAEVRETVRDNLVEDGYVVITTANARELMEKIKSKKADVILLDLNLPDGDGLMLISQIREYTDAPVIVVSGKAQMVDRVVGLEMGADDYIPKPFEMRELSARVKASIRRYHNQNTPEKKSQSQLAGADRIEIAGRILDRSQLQLFLEDESSANLTAKEFRVLEALALSPKRVFSREQLLDITREHNYAVFDRTIDIQITRIRKKIGDNADNEDSQIIKTVRGAGYMLNVDAAIAA
jgi:DNA-binding response OmpR family regulator